MTSALKKVLFTLIFGAFSILVVAQQKSTTPKKTVSKPVVSKTKTAKPVASKPIVPPGLEGKTKVKITTDLGVMVVRLYDSTPKHRDNFVKLVQEGFYDSLLFHRIIQGFMIQGGDPLSKNAPQGSMLGSGGGDMERIPAEFNRNIIHKKGALAAARDGNPEKASSACQFYIVQGSPVTTDQLKMMGQQRGFDYTDAQIQEYESLGGTPFLDMEYTVFGELISGFNVLDKIAAVKKNNFDRPNIDVHMKMKLIK